MQKQDYVLRAHHGMCAYFFKGKGYSDEFTAHMSEIVKNLKTGATVRLVDRVDEICQNAPTIKRVFAGQQSWWRNMIDKCFCVAV